MEVDLQVSQERRGRLEKAVEIVPPAMAGHLRLQVAPQALDQVEVGRIGRKEEGLEPIREALAVRTDCRARVGAGIVEHHHGWRALRQCRDEVVEEGSERGLAFARARLPDDLPPGKVDRAKDRELLVVACCRNP
jgi:hypothetical protein